MKTWISILVFAVFCFTAVSAQDAFLKIEGVTGEATDREHKDWINLASFSQAIHQPGGSATGATRRRGSVILEDITCVKELDKSSPKIAESVCNGKVFPKVEIHLTRSSGNGGRVTYYAYELKNVMVTSYQINSADGDLPVEEMSLNFEEIKVTYTEYDRQGRKKGNVEYSWKVEKGTK